METEARPFKDESKETCFQIFKDFMTRVAKLEELWSVGSRFLAGFQQGLEFLRRPPINGKSELIDNIIKANETERLKSYMAAGCMNNYDSIQNISKLHTGLSGIHDQIAKENMMMLAYLYLTSSMDPVERSIIKELENLLLDYSEAIQTRTQSFSVLRKEDFNAANLDQQASDSQEGTTSSDLKELELTDLAAFMGVIYSMLKQDFVMQEKIVASLNLKSSPGELESYCLMWSLRPFIKDELMREAWRHIH